MNASSSNVKFAPQTSTVKTEFTEVLAEPSLIGIPSAEEFLHTLVKTSLIEPVPSSPIDNQNLIEQYDEVFVAPEEYQKFVETKMEPFRNLMDFRYFDTLYTEHRSLSTTAKRLRQQAQQLLAEADRLTTRDIKIREQVERHVRIITRRELRERLFKPSLVRYRLTGPQYQVNPSTWTHTARRSAMSYNHAPRPLRCFQCNSPNHIKWQCDMYTCPKCGKRAPGHAQKNCREGLTFNDGLRGHYDIEGDYDGNLTGEC